MIYSHALRYPLANEKLQYLVDAFNAGTYFPLPDFVVGVGDMVNNATTADFNTLLPILDGLDCDYYSGVGNHEDSQQEGNATYLAPYRAAYNAGHENSVWAGRGPSSGP